MQDCLGGIEEEFLKHEKEGCIEHRLSQFGCDSYPLDSPVKQPRTLVKST